MDLETCFQRTPTLLMEGALGERLKREYAIKFDPNVAMASLVYNDIGRKALIDLWNQYKQVAETYKVPFLATTPTRRANKELVLRAGYTENIIEANMNLLKQIEQDSTTPMFIGGLMGCKGDAYRATDVLDVDAAREFHFWQADLFCKAGADFLYAGIMPAMSEAIGIAQAMEKTGLPYIISFMIKKNGRLIDGTTINDAIEQIDKSVEKKPICYMTNCVHPLILREALSYEFNKTQVIKNRFKGIQANTSNLAPEELDGSFVLKCSDPSVLAENIMELKNIIELKICGGCCGTNTLHIEEIAKRL